MELLALIVVVVLGAAGYFWWRARGAAEPKENQEAASKTVANLEPGDGLRFWDDDIRLVDAVLECTEQVGTRTTQWAWVILDDGRLVETAPDGNMLYRTPEVLHQGSAAFEQLTGAEGVLKTFEQKVREGVAGSQPAHFGHGRSIYQVKSTGTFGASIKGKLPKEEVLRDISTQASDNVYVEMEAAFGEVALGIWTTHIALYLGQPLKESDVMSIYPKGKETKSQ